MLFEQGEVPLSFVPVAHFCMLNGEVIRVDKRADLSQHEQFTEVTFINDPSPKRRVKVGCLTPVHLPVMEAASPLLVKLSQLPLALQTEAVQICKDLGSPDLDEHARFATLSLLEDMFS